MQSFKTVLKILANKNKTFVHKRLYRYLINESNYKYFNNINILKTEGYKPKRWEEDKPNRADLELSDKVAELLEAVFDVFEGYGRVHSPHRAIEEILGWKDFDTFLILDLGEFYNSLNFKILEKILREKIEDERLIRLLNKFNNAGYFIHFTQGFSHSKTFSSIKLADTLMNIYFLPLHNFLLSFENQIKFVRYNNQLLIALTETESTKFGDNLNTFFKDIYGSEIERNLRIYKDKFNFIEYDFRIKNDGIHVRVPQKKVTEVIREKGLVENIDAKTWKPLHRGYLLNNTDLEILKTYNGELKSIYLYYRPCENVSQKIGQLKYVMETSCLKTLAMKHRTGVKSIRQKYSLGDNWGIREGDTLITFYKGFKRISKPIDSEYLDRLSMFNKNKR